jgi:hypothetical protein
MNNQQRVYPESIEQQLDVMMSHIDLLDLVRDGEVRKEFVREEFGEMLFQKWLDGVEDVEISTEQFIDMLRMASAKSLLQNLKDKNLIDSVDDGEGNDYVFLTKLGKELMQEDKQLSAVKKHM